MKKIEKIYVEDICRRYVQKIKRSFTLVEFLVVILIVSMLLVYFWNIFSLNDKNFIQAQTCSNKIYWDISNFFNYAVTWRWIHIWTWYKYPDLYNVDLNYISKKITLNYSWSDWSWIFKTIDLTWSFWTSEDTKNNCYARNYYVNITWWIAWTWLISVNINKLLQWDINSPSFIINSDKTLFTWSVDLEYCDWKYCKPITKFFVDKRIQNIKTIRCMKWSNNWSICSLRSE